MFHTQPYLVEAHDVATDPEVPDEVLVERHAAHVEPVGGEGELRALINIVGEVR